MALVNNLLPAALFVAFANPETFKLVRGVAGGWVASTYGVPTNAGLILHAILFVLVVGFLMRRRFVSNYAIKGGDYKEKSSESHHGSSGALQGAPIR